MRAHVAAIVEHLRGLGAIDVRVEPGGKHPKVLFAWQGAARSYVVAGTPRSEQKAVLDSMRDIRHMLGLVPASRVIRARRAHRQKAARPQPLLTAGLGRIVDWHAELVTHPHHAAVLRARADEAWLQYWRSICAELGIVSRI